MSCGRKVHASGIVFAVLILLMIIALPSRPEASTMIQNSASMNNGMAGFGYSGYDSIVSYGQLITAPTSGDHYLSGFAFYLSPQTAHVYTTGAVYAWTGSGIGSCVYYDDMGGPMVTQQSPNGYQPVLIGTNFANLVPGQQYLLALMPNRYFILPGGENYADIGIVESGTDSYPGGKMMYRQGDTGAWVSLPTHPGQFLDVAFNAEFVDHGPVPEPATMILLGTGLAGLAGIRRRMKR